MNIDELWPLIVEAGQEHNFVLRPTAMPDHLPSAATVVEPAADDSGRWVVYFTERGEIMDPQYFADEDAACQFAYSRATAPQPPARTLTAAEREQADEFGAQAERERRQMLIDAGYDPDTMQKL
jgi:hypothetical protein